MKGLLLFLSFAQMLYANEPEPLKHLSKTEFVKQVNLPADWQFHVPLIEHNAYPAYRDFWVEHSEKHPKSTEAIDLAFQKAENYEKLSPAEFKRIESYLIRSRAIIKKALAIGSTRPFQRTDSSLQFDVLSPTRWMIRTLSRDALYAFRKGEHKKAISLISQAWNFSRKFDQQNGNIVDRLVAIAMKGITLKRIQWMILHSKSSRLINTLTQLIKDEDPFRWKQSLINEVDFGVNQMYLERNPKTLGERVNKTANALMVLSFPLNATELQNYEALTQKDAIMYPQLVQYTYAFWLDNLDPHTNQLTFTPEKFSDALFSPHPILETGLTIYTFLPLLDTLRLKMCEVRNRQKATRLAAAIRLFELKYKGLPKNLNSLIKAQLIPKALPYTCAFRAFHYSSKKRQISYIDQLTKKIKIIDF